ncbi:MAG: insulinase family protein, partial [Acidobacteria bacterium]|nr:insulinase family protein [Acidobacteriota bacterium]
GVPYADLRRVAVMGLSNILGGGTHSRLFYEIRERRALAYSVYTFMDAFADTGGLGVYAACSPSNVLETLTVLREQLRRIAEEPISLRELKDLREQLRGNLLLSLENTSTHMWRMIQHETYLRRHPTLAASLAEIEALTRKDIQTVARQLFLEQPLVMAAIGPIDKKQERLRNIPLI